MKPVLSSCKWASFCWTQGSCTGLNSLMSCLDIIYWEWWNLCTSPNWPTYLVPFLMTGRIWQNQVLCILISCFTLVHCPEHFLSSLPRLSGGHWVHGARQHYDDPLHVSFWCLNKGVCWVAVLRPECHYCWDCVECCSGFEETIEETVTFQKINGLCLCCWNILTS